MRPHADGIGSDEIIDIAVLIEGDLRVACAWRQCAEHDGSATDLAPQQLGHRVDFGCRKRHDRRALGQARDLFLAGVGNFRQAGARDEIGTRNEVGDGVAHRAGAQHQRFIAATRVQQPVGEDVAALGVGGELNFVDGEKIGFDVARHGLDGRDPIAGTFRLDLLLAGDQRHAGGADARDDLVVDLAREQPQRQSDHPGGMTEHALDGQMRFAGVRRTENGRDIADAGL